MSSLQEKIEESRRIAVLGHVNPDGDCVGSCLGIRNYIVSNYPGTSVTVFLETPPLKFRYLTGYDSIRHSLKDAEERYSLLICLDCGDAGRTGDFAPLLTRGDYVYTVDHHITNKGFGDAWTICPEAGSTSEILCDLLDMDRINRETAECFYTGIIHDTGVFRYSATSTHTMETAGQLIDKGVDFTRIIEESFYAKTYPQMRLLGYSLEHSELHYGGKVISSVITWKEMKQFKVTSEDMDGIAEKLREVDGADCSVFLHQTGEDSFKISMRSKHIVDVSRVAAAFGGGGHVRAAGCRMKGTAGEILEKLLNKAGEQL